MYAIIEDGGRQFKVVEGQEIQLDYRDASAGAELRFDRVLAYRDDEGLQVGQPTLDSATVTGKVLDNDLAHAALHQEYRQGWTL